MLACPESFRRRPCTAPLFGSNRRPCCVRTSDMTEFSYFQKIADFGTRCVLAPLLRVPLCFLAYDISFRAVLASDECGGGGGSSHCRSWGVFVVYTVHPLRTPYGVQVFAKITIVIEFVKTPHSAASHPSFVDEWQGKTFLPNYCFKSATISGRYFFP